MILIAVLITCTKEYIAENPFDVYMLKLSLATLQQHVAMHFLSHREQPSLLLQAFSDANCEACLSWTSDNDIFGVLCVQESE